jgi:hypothetical protein
MCLSALLNDGREWFRLVILLPVLRKFSFGAYSGPETTDRRNHVPRQASEIFIGYSLFSSSGSKVGLREIRRDSFFSWLTSVRTEKKGHVAYAAIFSQTYSWWNPPRTGRDMTRNFLCWSVQVVPPFAEPRWTSAGIETTVRAPSIVVTNPFRQEPTEMLFVRRRSPLEVARS